MFKHHLLDETSIRVRIHWLLLSFLAGNVNAGGLLAVHRFVTHVTGFATLFGLEAADGRFDQAFGILSVPIFFLLGVMTSAFFCRPKDLSKREA